MNTSIINEICNVLNIKYISHKHFTDGVSSKVFVLNDLYIVKQSSKEALNAEVTFLSLNESDLMQKIIYVDKNYDYVIYKFIDGEVMHRVCNPKDTIQKLKDIISNYKTTYIDGFGYMDEIVDTWIDFLKQETADDAILKYYVNRDKVDHSIENLNKYPFRKCLIHGDFGTHNFIEVDDKLVGIIDPMTIIGDPLYDLLFAICSNVDILKSLSLEDIYKLSDDDNDKIKNLLVVVLYARMIRCLKYHKEDIDIYLDFYKQIIL